MSERSGSESHRDVKSIARDRLRVEATWVTNAVTELFALGNVPNNRFRYIVAIYIKGNLNQTDTLQLELEDNDDNYHEKWSRIPIAPAAFIQIPVGGYDLEDSILTLTEGESLHGTVHVTGHSVNVTVAYWDNDV